MKDKKKIENFLINYASGNYISRGSQNIEDIIFALEDNDKIEYYLKLLHGKLSSEKIIAIITKIGKTEEYLNNITNGENIFDLSSKDIKNLVISTGNVSKYLKKELCQNLDIEDAKELINLVIDNENFKIIYDLGYNHMIIDNKQIIYDNLETILKIEEQTDKKEIILRLYESNHDILRVDFSILDHKYISVLGEERINLIVCYPYILEAIRQLDEIKLKILGKCLDSYQGKNDTDEWTPLCKNIIHNFDSIGEIINEIINMDEKEFEKIDFYKLGQIINNCNEYDLKSISQINKYEQIKHKKIHEWYENESNNIPMKINIICLSLFGQTSGEIQRIIEKYGECIDDIENEDLKYYIKGAKELLELKDEQILDEIFYNVEPVKNVYNIEIQRLLKNEYGKLYNKELLSIEDTVKNEELGENIYELAKDENGNIKPFNIIATSVAAFVDNTPENYYKDWNRPSMATQHFCTSYIRRDMLAMPPINYICYGFSNMKEDSLMLMGETDIDSSINKFVSEAGATKEKYYSPRRLINSTIHVWGTSYNELDFRRIQNGVKKQPDYIIVFRRYGKLVNLEEAKKASQDFKDITGTALPILIIDEDECLNTEKRILEEMIEEFKENLSTVKLEEIIQKIINNSAARGSFAIDKLAEILLIIHENKDKINLNLSIDMNKNLQIVKEYNSKMANDSRNRGNEDLKLCYETTNLKEQNEYSRKTKNFYKMILDIRKVGDDDDGR